MVELFSVPFHHACHVHGKSLLCKKHLSKFVFRFFFDPDHGRSELGACSVGVCSRLSKRHECRKELLRFFHHVCDFFDLVKFSKPQFVLFFVLRVEVGAVDEIRNVVRFVHPLQSFEPANHFLLSQRQSDLVENRFFLSLKKSSRDGTNIAAQLCVHSI